MHRILDCYDARLNTLPDKPTLRAATREQLCEHHKRLEQLNAAAIVPRFGTEPNDEYGFFESACHYMLEQEDYWRQCNLVWAWIDEKPVWLSPVDWYVDILPTPAVPTQRRIRFSMLGAGQITAIEHFKFWKPIDYNEIFHDRTDLRVTADAGSGLQKFAGVIDNSICCEMGAKAALFRPGTPQSIADRTAATFRLLTCSHLVGSSVRGPDPENFAALLHRSSQCCSCGRPLRDHVSTLLGIGPDCAKQLRLPHSLEAANRILARRRELLGEVAELQIDQERGVS